MFSSEEYLRKKTGPHGVDRFSFLQELVTEFQDTDSADAKEQVLANLANFAYDPINYEYLKQLHVVDLFLDCLEDASEAQTEFAIGGLCNISLEKSIKEYILKNDGVKQVTKCLSSSNEETVLSAITTLMNLTTPLSKPETTSIPIVDAMLRFSESKNPRLCNLSLIFLQDYCNKSQVARAEQLQKEWEDQVQAQAPAASRKDSPNS